LFFKKNSSCKQASKTSLINHLPSTIYKKRDKKLEKKKLIKILQLQNKENKSIYSQSILLSKLFKKIFAYRANTNYP
jgi:predicted ATP-dependent endonuclease of OLD family